VGEVVGHLAAEDGCLERSDDPQRGVERRSYSDPVGAARPLVEAKLAVPSVRHVVVDRPRVDRALDAGGAGSSTLVAAPAGYGKTTAVRAWCASREVALAWVTLDEGDNDPARLWLYVAMAVDRVRPGLGRSALGRLGVAGGSVEVAIDELMNAVAGLGSELVLVLDDLHAVVSEECLVSIDYALGRLPGNLRMVLLARVDPALRLARLRAADGLVEVRVDELAFTAAEARELLVVRGRIELSAEEIDMLVERTEGWPAALVLAWLWLRTMEDPARAVRAFGGDNRLVADYLSGEVLAALDEEDRAFLYGIAVLGQFTAEMCDAVLDRSDSAAHLAELERSNLFVSRLERGGWFRIHALFAEYARARLTSFDPSAPASIHRRAAESGPARAGRCCAGCGRCRRSNLSGIRCWRRRRPSRRCWSVGTGSSSAGCSRSPTAAARPDRGEAAPTSRRLLRWCAR
jgi:ATP/maltotriose-dependent transcriptional regulator MalT